MIVYKKIIDKNKSEIINSLQQSSEFSRENDDTWTKVISIKSRLNEIYLFDNNEEIQLSENAGLGLLGLIAKLSISSKNQDESILTVEFKIGVFSTGFLKKLIIFMIVMLPLTFVFTEVIGLLFVLLIILIWILLLTKSHTIKYILNKISKSLNVKNDWEKYKMY